MKKLLFLLSLIPSLTFAAPPTLDGVVTLRALTLAATTTTSSNGGKVAVFQFSSGSESAPSGTSALGVRLEGVRGYSVMVKSATNMTQNGVFQAYLYNTQTNEWVRVTSGALDFTVTSAATSQAWLSSQVFAGDTYITWRPSGVGVASTMYVIVTPYTIPY